MQDVFSSGVERASIGNARCGSAGNTAHSEKELSLFFDLEEAILDLSGLGVRLSPARTSIVDSFKKRKQADELAEEDNQKRAKGAQAGAIDLVQPYKISQRLQRPGRVNQ